MNLVDVFASIKTNTPKGKPKDVNYYLDRIRNGAVKETITSIRTSTSKKEKDELKTKLQGVTFAGTFTKRSKGGLKKASGLLILDIDKLTDVAALKEQLVKDKFVYSCWISPSGLGLKVLIKIPIVTSDTEYKQFYKSIFEAYKWIEGLDQSGSDISRLTFESYDPEIFINEEAQIWTDFVHEDVKDTSLGVVTNLPLKDQDEIANRLMVWFKKHYDSKQRNSSFFKLAAAFNSFGVGMDTALRYILPNRQKDFDEKEIEALVKSAYKNTSDFGTKNFEDKTAKKKLTNLVLSGKKTAHITSELSEFDAKKVEAEIEIIKSNIKVDEFWEYDKEGFIHILPYRFKLFLEYLKYFKYYPIANTKTFIFITKNDNFINNISEFQMKDVVMNHLIKHNNIQVFDAVADKSKLFTPQYLSMIDTADVSLEKDGVDFAMIYYKNTAIKVTKDKVKQIEYNDLEGYVWENQVINRNFTKGDHHESMFRTFVWKISGEDVSKYNTFKSIIGYLLHSYKNSANNKAVILNDETISENPNGGSGKGILTYAIGQMKKVSTIDGKSFDFNKSFPYQTVSTDCQILAFDDVRRNFEFERLFSLITEGITIEYKGKDAIKLPVKDSPKILISTNYTVKADGGSFLRRIFEVELSSFFGVHHTPFDEFGCMLFEEWDEQEWARFDMYMINCLQYYLENGLVKSETKNLKIRKLQNETSVEFIEFADNLKTNERLNKAQYYEAFLNEHSEFRKFLTKRTFNKYLQKYCAYKDYKFLEGNTNGSRWFEMVVDGEEVLKDPF